MWEDWVDQVFELDLSVAFDSNHGYVTWIILAHFAIRFRRFIHSLQTAKSRISTKSHVADASQLVMFVLLTISGKQFDCFVNLEGGNKCIWTRDCWHDLPSHLFDLKQTLHLYAEVECSNVSRCRHEVHREGIVLIKDHPSNLFLFLLLDLQNCVNKQIDTAFDCHRHQTLLWSITEAFLLETRLIALIQFNFTLEICEGECFDFIQEFLRLLFLLLRYFLFTFGESVSKWSQQMLWFLVE